MLLRYINGQPIEETHYCIQQMTLALYLIILILHNSMILFDVLICLIRKLVSDKGVPPVFQ